MDVTWYLYPMKFFRRGSGTASSTFAGNEHENSLVAAEAAFVAVI